MAGLFGVFCWKSWLFLFLQGLVLKWGLGVEDQPEQFSIGQSWTSRQR